MSLNFSRTRIQWDEDSPIEDFGWRIMLTIRGKHRARWSSTRGTTRSWPGFSRGGDENCNRAVTLMLWPIGHLDIWWETHWRTDEDGMCDDCRSEYDQ